MKKFILICLCLTLMVAVIIPTAAFAAEPANSDAAEDIIYFLNPTAITAVGDYLFVADNIEEGKSAIITFDISGDKPERTSSLELDHFVVNLAGDGTTLYAITDSKAIKLDIENDALTFTGENIEVPNDTILDMAFSDDNVILLTSKVLKLNGEDGYRENFTSGDAIACTVSGDYLYYLYDNNGTTEIKRRQTSNFLLPTEDSFNNSLTWPQGFQARGIFAWEDGEVAIFGQHGIYFSESSSLDYSLRQLISIDEYSIKDVAITDNKLYVLNDNHQIIIYENDNNSLTEKGQIGSDTLAQEAPDVADYTSFTLVRSKGYPTNIVFKTKEEANSIKSIITAASEYIVIGFDGEKNFYYVLIRDGEEYKFGWVKKSDDAIDVNHDSKLEVVNTNWSNDNADYKFSSLYGIFIYDLPYSQSNSHSITQTANDRIDVTILQGFEEKVGDETIVWLYISFEYEGAAHTGFVREKDVGDFSLIPKNTETKGQFKINSTLFSSVRVYKFGDPKRMTDEYLAVYTKTVKIGDETVVTEEVIPPLYSGNIVYLISEENGIAYVQVRRSDGAIGYGYVYADRLIGAHEVTTNAAVGLTLLTIAIVLTVVLIVLFIQRRRKKSVKQEKTRKEKE